MNEHAALVGSPDSVRRVGSWLRGREVGSQAYSSLRTAAASLESQSGSAVSVTRVLTMIQVTSTPANLVQHSDQEWGDVVGRYGAQVEDIQRRARRAQADAEEAGERAAMHRATLDEIVASASTPASHQRKQLATRALTVAVEELAAAEHRLRALNAERRGVDASCAEEIAHQRAQYGAVRNTLPQPPQVSAQVRVSGHMPDGTERHFSALELANLVSPEVIASVWNTLTTEERRLLIDDNPLLIGNLEGVPLRDRHLANAITATAYRSELEDQIDMFRLLHGRDGGAVFTSTIERLAAEIHSIDAMLGDRNEQYAGETSPSGLPFGRYVTFDEEGRERVREGAVLVGFNPYRDSFITYQGALDPVTGNIPGWARQVGVLIPGTTSQLATITSDIDRARDMFELSGTKTGYFVWHGAPMPEFTLSNNPARRGFAEVAGPRLTTFANSLQLAHDTHVVPVAHSYGAAVLGRAELLGLRADRVVYVAPAGLGHDAVSVADFPHTGDAPHFVVQARNDPIALAQWASGTGVGHGPNPLQDARVVRLETGYVEAGHPASGSIESTGPVAAHSNVFLPESTALVNTVGAVTGGSVSLFQPDDAVQSGRGWWAPVSDTGVAKPEVRVSSLDIAGVL